MLEYIVVLIIFLFQTRICTRCAYRYGRDLLTGSNSITSKAQKLLESLKEKGIFLNKYEKRILTYLVDPDDIDVKFSDIGGLKDVCDTIRFKVIVFLQMIERKSKESKYLKPPKGVLLHGPPGCGKTMIAKATAKEANVRFINLDVGELTDKGYDEAPKLAAAVFTLARKLKPCIIFIDEIDKFLRPRNKEDHEATSMIKSQFMTYWDGFSSDSAGVVIMGATNVRRNIDTAILRRMPLRLLVPLPSQESRGDIIRILLRAESIDPRVSYETLSQKTDRFSASNLEEMCRLAIINPISKIRNSILSIMDGGEAEQEIRKEIRKVSGNCNMEDFDEAIKEIMALKRGDPIPL